MKLQAVNNVIIVDKEKSPLLTNINDMTQIPEPYVGYIDSIGFETNEYQIGERVAFCDMGGAYIQMGEKEYVVLTPDMIIGKLN